MNKHLFYRGLFVACASVVAFSSCVKEYANEWVDDDKNIPPFPEVIDVTTSGRVGNYDYVDLGLPSGTKWATYNVGAHNSIEYGDYFAWGETKPKNMYYWSTYDWCRDSSAYKLTKYCTNDSYGWIDYRTFLEEEDDVVSAIWGAGWRMPTDADFLELKNGCMWKFVDDFAEAGAHGLLGVSVKNGNIIFLPAAGMYVDSDIRNLDRCGYYWTSENGDSDPRFAACFNFTPAYYIQSTPFERCDGCNVRAVSK